MDIMELGAIGELVGGLAVIGSLLFVGIQIRRSNATDTLSASLGLQRSHNEMVQFLCADPARMHEGLGAFNDLPEPARIDLAAKLYHLYGHSELVFQQMQKGLIDSETANRHFGWLFWVQHWPGPQEWWNVGPIVRGERLAANREIFSSDFARFVESGSPTFASVEEA